MNARRLILPDGRGVLLAAQTVTLPGSNVFVQSTPPDQDTIHT
jgi:hypothetical protein